MSGIYKSFLEWFGYSRRERRATLVLLLILLIFIAVPYIFNTDGTEPENLSYLLSSADKLKEVESKSNNDTSVLFMFDPNSSSFDTLIHLGLTLKQAKTLINFRDKGGRFRNPEDIKRVYGIDEKTSARLLPYINIERRASNGRTSVKDSSAIQNKVLMVDINRADSSEFDKLPGIGPVLSSRIVKYRRILGGYVSVDQLREVYGLSESTFNKISGKVSVDSSLINKIDINNVGQKDLAKHPYLSRADVLAILRFREITGKIRSAQELEDNNILTAEKVRKIYPYLKF